MSTEATIWLGQAVRNREMAKRASEWSLKRALRQQMREAALLFRKANTETSRR